jgi:hypothetical protein
VGIVAARRGTADYGARAWRWERGGAERELWAVLGFLKRAGQASASKFSGNRTCKGWFGGGGHPAGGLDETDAKRPMKV